MLQADDASTAEPGIPAVRTWEPGIREERRSCLRSTPSCSVLQVSRGRPFAWTIFKRQNESITLNALLLSCRANGQEDFACSEEFVINEAS
jgi:hypothetical protein